MVSEGPHNMPVRFRLSTLMIVVAFAAVVMGLIANRLMLPILAWMLVSSVVSSPLIATNIVDRRRRARGRPMTLATKLAFLTSFSVIATVVTMGMIMAVIIVMKAR